jgi:hypothetical protein
MYESPDESKFEIHKLQSGDGLIVGFVGPDAAQKLALPHPPNGFEFTIYSKRWTNAPAIIALPISVLKGAESTRLIPLKEFQISAWDARYESTNPK